MSKTHHTNTTKRKLILIRHGESEFNKINVFTGKSNPGLTEKGERQAVEAGSILSDCNFDIDIVFTSKLKRAQHTTDLVLNVLKISPKIFTAAELNERDYGSLTGLNKDEARERFGAEQVHQWRRSWEVSPPDGESLYETAKRVQTYFENSILDKIKEHKNILIIAHGNSLRSLIMKLEELTPKAIEGVSLKTGDVLVYDIDLLGNMQSGYSLN